MNWKHGYYADSGYTYGYYSETSPLRLAWAALIQGHQAPRHSFRYLDAGCGQGLSLLLMAAAHPDSEFVGIDFLPEHIAHANNLATRIGLTNVKFLEGDFIELARNPSNLGEFDFAVCHGITTWIAPAVKQSLFKMIGSLLKPGGLFYNSYNTYPGWLPTVPFQHLVLLEQRSKTGALALNAARSHMERLLEAAPGMFNALPGLTARLKNMDTQDPAYLVQEYNNNYWQPVFVTQMMDDLAAVKLNYLGTATLAEAYDTVLSAPVRALIAEQSVPAIREQLRDYATNQTFRRDLYVKGQCRPWPVEQESAIRAYRLTLNPTTPRPKEGESFVFRSGAVELNGEWGFYSGLLEQLESSKQKHLSVSELIEGTPAERRGGVLAALSMLMHGGWVLPYVEVPKGLGRACNQAIGDAIGAGAPYRYVSAPATGGALPMGDADWIIFGAYLHGLPETQWREHLDSTLSRLRRGLTKDGKVVTEPEERRRMQEQLIIDFKADRLPFLLRTCAA
jgi:SAM-dependent methyltransferase